MVDLASGNRRIDYVAVGNSVTGVALLLLGAMGGVAQLFPVRLVVFLLSVLGLAGAALGRTLPEVTA